MQVKQILAEVEKYIAPIVQEHNCELFDLEYVKEGSNWYLRIYIDKDGGVTIDDCEKISRATEKSLDQHDPIETAYILEVSSPGIDRPLRKTADFEKYKGRMVDIKLFSPIDKKKAYQGVLVGLANDAIVITLDDGTEKSFAKSAVASCRLSVIF